MTSVHTFLFLLSYCGSNYADYGVITFLFLIIHIIMDFNFSLEVAITIAIN